MSSVSLLGAGELAAATVAYRDALKDHEAAINRLNVYPVPDGDTGTNMARTLDSVVAELEEMGAIPSGTLPGGAVPAGSIPGGERPGMPGMPGMPEVCRALAHGSLMGARGNSGVILCQLLRGLASVLSAHASAGPAEVAAAIAAASEAAREAVLRPVEGTILSVARAASEGARDPASSGASLVEVLDSARTAAAKELERTPDLLPVLARAGVVDAGGAGFLLLLDALLSVVDGRPLPKAPAVTGEGAAVGAGADASIGAREGAALGGDGEPAGGEGALASLRYEVMYFLEASDDTIPAFKDVWAGIGDSIVVVGGEGLWNCHIHTDDVGAAIEAALDAGRPRNIRVTDLADQVEEERWVREWAVSSTEVAASSSVPVGRTAVVAVANGDGIGRIFRSLGVHYLVPGGQSMNPSTAEILAVVDSVPSAEVVILPNNENVVPVAMQVCELAGKKARTVPTGGIVEGFAALLEYDPEAGAEENAAAMAASARRVVAGEVTRAVRDAEGPEGPIAAGDWLGLSRDGVEVVEGSLAGAVCALLERLVTEEHELVTLIEGEGAGHADTRRVAEWLSEYRPDVTLEVHHGGQPLYPYLVSIE